MCMLIDIEAQIADCSDREIREILEDFQYITLLESYLTDDAENYLHASNYIDLLVAIADYTGLAMRDFAAEEVDDRLVFSLNLDGNPVTFSIDALKGDWLDEYFLHGLNELLRENGIDKQLHNVFVRGMAHASQCFHLVFIDDATYQELAAHPAHFVEPDFG